MHSLVLHYKRITLNVVEVITTVDIHVKSRTNLQVCFAFTFIFSNELINVILTAVYYVS